MRVRVVGNSGSGKSTFGRRLSTKLGVPYVELDALNHRPGWTEAPVHEFRAEVASRLAEHERTSGGWGVDGNYRSRLGDVANPDLFVWLDYPRMLTFLRVLRRTLSRVLFRRSLWNGNRERVRNLVSRDPQQNILLWSWTQHHDKRSRYESASIQEPERWVRLQNPREAEAWLRGFLQ